MSAISRKTALVISLILFAGALPIAWYLLDLGDGLTEKLTENRIENTYQEMSLFEKISAFIGGFVVKPLHMILSALAIWVLLRMRAPVMIALRWGLFFFLLGETSCAINYLVFKHGSHLAEYLHSYGMVVGFGFSFYTFTRRTATS